MSIRIEDCSQVLTKFLLLESVILALNIWPWLLNCLLTLLLSIFFNLVLINSVCVRFNHLLCCVHIDT